MLLYSPKIIFSLAISFAIVIVVINFPSTGRHDGAHLNYGKSSIGPHYDKSRDPMVLKTKKRKKGEVYERKIELKLVTETPLEKPSIKRQFNIAMETKETIEDYEDSQSLRSNIFFHFTRATHDSVTNRKHSRSSSVSCDTNISRDEAETECLDLYDMLGQNQYVVNGDGTTIDFYPRHQMGEKIESVEDIKTKQVRQIARLLKHIPSKVAVKVGDVWNASTDMEDRGWLSATGTLLGYVDYDGFDCAAIDIKGTLKMESKQVMEMMGGTIASAISSQIIVPEDATLHTIMYYDHLNGLIRWSSSKMSMVIIVRLTSGYGLTMPITEFLELKLLLSESSLYR